MNFTKVVWKTQFGFIVIQESLDEWLLPYNQVKLKTD